MSASRALATVGTPPPMPASEAAIAVEGSLRWSTEHDGRSWEPERTTSSRADTDR